MPRQPTGRSSILVRTPAKYKLWTLDAIQQMRKSELPPMPAEVVRLLIANPIAYVSAWNALQKREVMQAIAPWSKKVIAIHGKLRAKYLIEQEYGMSLASIAVPVPPLHGAWHTILGVSASATSDEVKAAYRQLSSEWHPDVNPTEREFCQDVQKALNKARDIYRMQINASVK